MHILHVAKSVSHSSFQEWLISSRWMHRGLLLYLTAAATTSAKGITLLVNKGMPGVSKMH